MMIPKALHDITIEDISNLVQNSIAENKTTEFKSTMAIDTGDERKEFLADVSAFANTQGGDLIFGIKDDDGIAAEITGFISDKSDDALKQQLDNIIQSGIAPRIRYDMRIISGSDAKRLLIIRIDSSWIGPHRVEYKNSGKFYARNTHGKYMMDVDELRRSFTYADTLIERARKFRNNQLSKILCEETPVQGVSSGKFVFHLIPITGSMAYDVCDVSKEREYQFKIFRKEQCIGRSNINFDGIVFYGDRNNSNNYIQLFRNGAFELCFSNSIWSKENGVSYYNEYITENTLLQLVPELLDIQYSMGLNPPILAAMTLINISGYVMHQGNSFRNPKPIRNENLIIPDVLINAKEQSIPIALKFMFDIVWNAFGFKETPSLDKDGKYSDQM